MIKTWYGCRPAEGETHFKEEDSIAFLRLVATQMAVIVKDAAGELGLSTLETSQDHGTVVLLPLSAHGQLQGAFLVTHLSSSELGVDNPFSDQTLAIMQGIAQQTSVALENINLVEKRQEEAYITAVLLQVAQAVVSQNELDDILDTIVHLVPILVGVDTCAFYQLDKDSGTLVPNKVVSNSHTLEAAILDKQFVKGEFGLLDTIVETNTPVACALDDPEMPFEKWTTLTECAPVEGVAIPLPSGKNHWIIGFPLSIKGEVFGVMISREANVPREFQAKRLELLTGVAQQVALAIQNDRFKNEMVDRERIDREIQLARQIQETFLPNKVPQPKGWDVAVRWRTAREVGGDFYDIFMTRNQSLGMAIADVADKGMP
ncbi:GAF domain-containing protein, partial [bacterium]|nr:GAF domain-containing protein [bacterium]